ncbi:hypothetical protein NL676_033517 [Syzygium grande]|nr:hypothetical protein NL676_033517 [Syzygium grande]
MTAKVMTVEGDDLTILDIAILVGQDQLVENLVKRFPLESEAFTISALSHATRRGRIRGVKELVDKLDKVGEQGGTLALLIATTNAPRQKELIRYLAMNTKSTPEDDTISNFIRIGHLETVAYWKSVFTNIGNPCLVDTSFDNAKEMKMAQVPASNDNSTGIPIILEKGSFMVFAVANALALFSSITATLMFLAILTSRYATEDFLHPLPRKLTLGLTFLFLSLAFMLVAFGSVLMIVLSERLKWIYIPVTLLAAIPVILFAIPQLPLYVEMVESTYRPCLYRPIKIWK